MPGLPAGPAARVATASRNPLPDDAARAELLALVQRARAVDLDAQSELVRRYLRRIQGHVRPIIRQPDAVEDVAQMVFIKMARRLPRLREPATFESWLFTLSRNTALDFVRRRLCRPVIVGAEDDTFEAVDPANSRALDEVMEALDLALPQLSPKDRNIVNAIVDGHSYLTVACREGLTQGAVKARLNRMRPFLRTCVGEAAGVRVAAVERPRLPRLKRWPVPASAPASSRRLAA